MDCNKVNYRILELCNQKNWSKYKLAQESQISNSAINAMFKHNHIPTIYNLEKICAAFNISLSQFFDCDLFDTDTPTAKARWVVIYIHFQIYSKAYKTDKFL